jgi:hypothetical protein
MEQKDTRKEIKKVKTQEIYKMNVKKEGRNKRKIQTKQCGRQTLSGKIGKEDRQREKERRKWVNQQRMIKEQNRTHKIHLTAKYYESSPIVFLCMSCRHPSR